MGGRCTAVWISPTGKRVKPKFLTPLPTTTHDTPLKPPLKRAPDALKNPHARLRGHYQLQGGRAPWTDAPTARESNPAPSELTESASLRLCALVRTRAQVVTRLRFFSASKQLDGWSALNMAPVLDLLRAGLVAIIADATPMLDANYDMFAPLRATTPEYLIYLRELESSTGLAVDKKTRVSVYTTVCAEIYDPQDDDNKRVTPQTLEHIKAFATGMLQRFEHGNAMRYVDDGEYSVANQVEDMIEAFESTDRNTNAMEGFWGHIKYIDSIFHAATYNTNAVVCAQKDNLYGDDSAQYVVRREERHRDDVSAGMSKKRARDEVQEGRVGELSLDVQAACFECARTTGLAEYVGDARADDAARQAAEVARFEQRKKDALQKQVKSYVAARSAMTVTPIIPRRGGGGPHWARGAREAARRVPRNVHDARREDARAQGHDQALHPRPGPRQARAKVLHVERRPVDRRGGLGRQHNILARPARRRLAHDQDGEARAR